MDGEPVGSRLAGQAFEGPEYFHPRPSGTDPVYNAAGTTFANLGPTNPELAAAVEERAQAILDARRPVQRGSRARGHPRRRGHDLGLRHRPAHLAGVRRAPGGARRGGARALDRERVRELVDEATDGRSLGFFGEPGVNVLELNIALDEEGPMTAYPETPRRQQGGLVTPEILRAALVDSLRKLNPAHLVRNPVIFLVEVASVIVTFVFFRDLAGDGGEPAWFTATIAVWLWLTVLFANLAEAVAEGRGKAQANALRATRTTTVAHRRVGDRPGGGSRSRASPRRRRRRHGRPGHPGRR